MEQLCEETRSSGSVDLRGKEREAVPRPRLTFRDLPDVVEPAAQRDGDGRHVGHVVAVAVHPAVSSGADRLQGRTGAVETRVRDAPHRRAAVATEEEEGREGSATSMRCGLSGARDTRVSYLLGK